MSKLFAYMVPFLALPGLAAAQSSLGLNLASVSAEHSGDMTSALVQMDVLFTPYHGLQGDLGVTRIDGSTIGHVAGHLYLTTNEDQKYGLFAAYHDWNDASIAAYTIGVEGQFGFNDHTSAGFQLGMGKVDPGEVDYIFASFNIAHEVSDKVTLSARYDITDIEEADFSSTAHNLEIATTLSLSPSASFVTGVRHSKLTGDMGGSKTTGFAGLNITFGRNGQLTRRTPFATPQPLRPYWQRGAALR